MFAFELKATVSKQEMMQQYYKLNSFKLLDEEKKQQLEFLGGGVGERSPLTLRKISIKILCVVASMIVYSVDFEKGEPIEFSSGRSFWLIKTRPDERSEPVRTSVLTDKNQ